MFLLALPITIIGANFNEEYERSQRGAALDKKSRVVKYNALTRNGTRPLVPDGPSLRDRVSTRVSQMGGSVKKCKYQVTPVGGQGALSTPGGGGGAEGLGSKAYTTSNLAGGSSKYDEHFEDQAYNVQADVSMLLDEHFEAMREKFNGILRRNTDNLNRWVTTDLRYIDAESKTAAQVTSSAVMKFKCTGKKKAGSSLSGSPGNSFKGGGAAAAT